MKTKVFYLLCALLALGLVFGPLGWSARAQEPQDLEDDIELSIQKGLDWLAGAQTLAGYWGDYEQAAHTCFALVKLQERAHELLYPSPFDPSYPYSANVLAGWNFLFSVPLVYQETLSDQWHDPVWDNPDTNGNGYGLIFSSWGSHPSYTTGICLMALVASGELDRPNEGGLDFNGDGNPDTYGEIAQETVDWLAFAQADIDWCEGGWGYGVNDNACNWADNSNAGYAVLGLAYAQKAGLVVPDWVRTELNFWIDHIQCKTAGPDFGGSGYTDGCGWVNELKGGNLIFEMTYFGDNMSVQRFKDAVDYIETHWMDMNVEPGWGYMTNPANYQAMYTLMKGFQYSIIDWIDLDGDGTPEHKWFDEFATVLIGQQNPDGSWPECYWGNPVLCTTWALLTLEKLSPRFEVPVDIKPMSCPNPLNVGDKGVLPVAILGTEVIDVAMIDPASVTLEGVSPLRWSYQDVSTPYEPYMGKTGAYACNTLGPDGYLDLSFKFNSQEVVMALGPANDGDVLVLTLTGTLKPEFGSRPFIGEDVVWIVKK